MLYAVCYTIAVKDSWYSTTGVFPSSRRLTVCQSTTVKVSMQLETWCRSSHRTGPLANMTCTTKSLQLGNISGAETHVTASTICKLAQHRGQGSDLPNDKADPILAYPTSIAG